jgi:hypothetical protein
MHDLPFPPSLILVAWKSEFLMMFELFILFCFPAPLFLFLLFFDSIIYNDGQTISAENELTKSFDR